MPSDATRDQFFQNLYMEHYKYIFNLCNKMLRDPAAAEDMTQETFIRAYSNITQLKSHPNIVGWLTLVASNIHKDAKKSAAGRIIPFSLDELNTEPAHTDSIEAIELQDELSTYLKPDEVRLVLLYYKYGFPVEELAKKLGITSASCKVRLFRARQKLKKNKFRNL